MYAYLLKEMKSYIQKHIIDRGYAYFEDGNVEDLDYYDDSIYAYVTGNYGDYEVKIDLRNFGNSLCECPYDNYCKHMAAVVFAVQQTDMECVTKQLQEVSKEELITIIHKLIAYYPKNIVQVEEVLRKKEK